MALLGHLTFKEMTKEYFYKARDYYMLIEQYEKKLAYLSGINDDSNILAGLSDFLQSDEDKYRTIVIAEVMLSAAILHCKERISSLESLIEKI